jgi:hypothetical protein
VYYFYDVFERSFHLKKYKKLSNILVLILFCIIPLAYYIYYYDFKEFNILEEEINPLDAEDIKTISKENEDILNHIVWNRPGYKLLKYKDIKIVYIRVWDKSCNTDVVSKFEVKNNELSVKMFKRDHSVFCPELDSQLKEIYWMPKNQDFDKVKIYLKKKRINLKELKISI